MKAVIKNEWKSIALVLVFGLAMYLAGFLTAWVIVDYKAEQAIDQLLVKQPTILKQYEGYKFQGQVFIDCIKDQDTVDAHNTTLCLSASAYKP